MTKNIYWGPGGPCPLVCVQDQTVLVGCRVEDLGQGRGGEAPLKNF